MARKYVRDNRGRFASVGATARGGRLKTASGGRRATVTRQINVKSGSTISRPKGYKAPAATTKPAVQASPSSAPKRISYRLAYHGTSREAAESIRRGGYQETRHGTFGPGVYATTSKKAAREYADWRSAGGKNRFGESFAASAKGPAVLVHRVPKSRVNDKPLPGYLQRDWVSSMGNARRVDKQATGHSPYLVMGAALANSSLARGTGTIRSARRSRRRKP